MPTGSGTTRRTGLWMIGAAAAASAAVAAAWPLGCSKDGCDADADCDDGVFCNGTETCGRSGRCYPAVRTACDDALACTDDSCDEAARTCRNVAQDRDEDGYMDTACDGDDCDDGDPDVHPGADERCNGVDDDCDDVVAEDRDGDGRWDPAVCPGDGDDCDDDDFRRFPGAPEACDGIDNNCDGSVEDEADTDGDTAVDSTCAGGTDCDDEDAAVHPGAGERCNGRDDDCDMLEDETFPCAQGESVSCWTSCGTVGGGRCTSACALPEGRACTPPRELCGNGIDDDCDGETDEGCTTPDGGCVPSTEACNGIDDDCDGETDEGGVCDRCPICAPGTYRHCAAAGDWGWGIQVCGRDARSWGTCLEDAPAPGCLTVTWDGACCLTSGGCCQDTGDSDGDGRTDDSVGLGCPPPPACG